MEGGWRGRLGAERDKGKGGGRMGEAQAGREEALAGSHWQGRIDRVALSRSHCQGRIGSLCQLSVVRAAAACLHQNSVAFAAHCASNGAALG